MNWTRPAQCENGVIVHAYKPDIDFTICQRGRTYTVYYKEFILTSRRKLSKAEQYVADWVLTEQYLDMIMGVAIV